MPVKVMVKKARGCGFRTPRGYYLCNERGVEMSCHRLPIPIPVCDACGRPLIHPTRGIQRIEPNTIWTVCDMRGDMGYLCHRNMCPICYPPEKAYVIWVGEAFYENPASYLEEAYEMGVSRKVRAVPEDLVIGDWVFLGYRKIIPTGTYDKDQDEILEPGIFHAFRVTSIEKVLTDAQQKDQYYIKSLLDRGITPVIEVDSEDQIKYAKARISDLSKFAQDEPQDNPNIVEDGENT